MMRTKWMKLTAMLLVVCMMFGLTACGKPSIVGTWKGTMEVGNVLTQTLTEALGEEDMAELAAYLDLEGMQLDMLVEFDAEGNCAIRYEQASAEAFTTEFVQRFSDAMKAYLDEYLKSVGFSVEQILAQSGKTWDEYLAESIDISELADGFLNEFEMKYQLEDEHNLYTYNEGQNYDEGECTVVQVGPEKMVWVSMRNMDDSEDSIYWIFGEMLPIEFIRQ